MRVEDIMKHEVYACQASDSVNSPAKIMWEHDCGCVPVVDDNKHVVGMITDRDVCMAAYTQGKPLWAMRVGDAMSRPVFACQPETSVKDAVRIMRVNQVHRLPVVDEKDRLVGILSLADLAQEARRQASLKKKQITFAEIGETLEAICKPRST